MLRQFMEAAGSPFGPSAIGNRSSYFPTYYKNHRILQKAKQRDANLRTQISKDGMIFGPVFERITGVSYSDYQAALNTLQLVNTKIISDPASASISERLPATLREEVKLTQAAHKLVKSTFSKYQSNCPLEAQLYKLFNERNATGRKMDMISRLSLEVANAVMKNHTIVFDTLTVRDEDYDLVFRIDPNGTFGNYLKRFKYRTDENAVYFAVVESGSKTQRLHIHVLWFIPKSAHQLRWADPCALHGAKARHIAEIGDLKTWPHGEIRTTTLVRWAGDSWSEFHKWPTKRKDPVQPLAATPGAIVGYVVKYLTKDVLEQKQQWEKRWRIRKTQSLGLRLINSDLAEMPLAQLTALTVIPLTEATKKYRQMIVNSAKIHLGRRLAISEPTLLDVMELPSRNVLKEALQTLLMSQSPVYAELVEENIGSIKARECNLAGAFDPETGHQITAEEWEKARASAYNFVSTLQAKTVSVLDDKRLTGDTCHNDASRKFVKQRTEEFANRNQRGLRNS